MKCCLTIAGSDCGGNAGVQADLRAFHAYGLHGCTVFTALTAQNPFGVSAIHQVPADFVAAQLDAVLGVYDIAAAKTGMLGDVEVIKVVAEKLKAHPEIRLVVDPVMIATSGVKLVSEEAIEAAKEYLFPLATVITPNIPEAEVLGLGDAAAEEQRRYGILVKGGHAEGADAVDTLYLPSTSTSPSPLTFTLPRIENPVSTHGTGCTMAAAITAELALGRDLVSAVEGAKRTVHSAIERSYFVGENCGVLGFPEVKKP